MTVVPWDPLKELLALKDRMNKIIENAMSRTEYGGAGEVGTWSPAVDVYETPERFVLAAELPGLSPEEIDVRIAGGTLTLRGERKLEKGIEEGNYHRIERSYGTFVRSFPLPPGVEASGARAEYRLGVLTIEVPRAASTGQEQVRVTVS
jgi:HSP20 family protein